MECVMHRTFESETTSGDFSPSLDPFAERSNSYAHTHFSNSPRERQYKIESISLEIYVREIFKRDIITFYTARGVNIGTFGSA